MSRSRKDPRRCPYCAGAARWLFEAMDRNRRLPGAFDYYRCGSCRLVFIASIPENLRDYYVGGYQAIPVDLDQLRRMAASEEYRLEPVLRFQKSGRLLEIGPWIGLFSSVAKDAGFDVTAIEADGDCVRLLNDVLGITAVQSSDPAATLAALNDPFEVIAMWHSIEHLARPWDAIREAARKLAPGGILLVAAPSPDSVQFRLVGRNWYHLDAPRHVYLLPVELLKRVALEHGLEPVFETTTDPLGRILDRDGWNDYVWHCLRIRGFFKNRLAPILRRALRSDREGRGAAYTVVFERPA